MTDISPSKDHKGENFPVASWFLKKEHRLAILTFYKFARKADDIADDAAASEPQKLAQLADMRVGLGGAGAAEAMALVEAAKLGAGMIDLAHAHDLLDAFTLDVTKRRYADWQDLMAYCRLSAMPVGRFVLDVHGEDRTTTWPLSDPLCAALQVINHLQDCAKDYLEIDRVYIPEPMLSARGMSVEVLGKARSSAALLEVIRDLARQTQELLRHSAPFAKAIRDRRLSAEVAVIQRLAEDLTQILLTRDPLADKVHHSKARMASLAVSAIARNLFA